MASKLDDFLCNHSNCPVATIAIIGSHIFVSTLKLVGNVNVCTLFSSFQVPIKLLDVICICVHLLDSVCWYLFSVYDYLKFV